MVLEVELPPNFPLTYLDDEKKKICTVHGGEVSKYCFNFDPFLVLGSKFIHSVRIV